MPVNIEKRLFVIWTLFLNAISAYAKGYSLGENGKLMTNNDLLRQAEVEPRSWFESFNPENETYFLLYTKKNPNEPQNLNIGDDNSFVTSNFNAAYPVRIIVHGFRDGMGSYVSAEGRKGLFQKGDFNVIVVDWSKGADTLNYLEAVDRTYGVGKVIAKFIDYIHRSRFIPLSSIYIIGHSLGAHIAGMAGKNVQDGKVAVIMGLDPAGPFFSYDKPFNRLDKDDAEYVQVVHTNAGTQGFEEPIGHADFYAGNHGRSQPGCEYDWTGACSHQRSNNLWGESIHTKIGFWASPCAYEDIKRQNCTATSVGQALMGGDPVDRAATGVFYLSTNSKSPYAMGRIK